LGFDTIPYHNHSPANRRGYSSGSAGGTVVPPSESQTLPPQREVDEPHVKTEPGPPAGIELGTHENACKHLEETMMKRLEEKLFGLEQKFLGELEEKKRKAHEEMMFELNEKRRKIDDEIFELEEEKILHESRLAMASEQLQERMVLVADEQKTLDDLREKSRTMRQELEAAGREKEQLANQAKREAQEKKELLRQKLEATAKKNATPESVSPSPASVASQPTVSPFPSDERNGGEAVALVSDQRFTSSTHPQAWHCLYRMTRKADSCDAEIYKLWHEGGVMLGYWM